MRETWESRWGEEATRSCKQWQQPNRSAQMLRHPCCNNSFTIKEQHNTGSQSIFRSTVPCCHSHCQMIFGKNVVPQLKVYAEVLAGRHSRTLFYTGKHTGLSPADTRCEATPWIGGSKRPSIFQMLWTKLSKLKGIKSLFLFSDEIRPSQW